MRNMPVLIALAGLLLSAASPPVAQDDPRGDKAPVPDAAAQKEAEKLIRDVFKDEYARTSAADRLDLARKLLRQGIDTADDPVSRFVLLREARDLSAQGGDCDTAFAAIEELDRSFRIDAPAMKSAVLSTLARTAKDPDTCKRLAAAFLQAAEDALAAGDCDTASKAAASAASLARKSKDLPLATRAEAKVKEYADIKTKSDAMKAAREKLAANPEDPAANLAVGRFLCLVMADWEEGLPLLAKGSDETLKSLAEKELSAPADAASQMAIGDGWWDLAEKEPAGRARENLRSRAAEWYGRAVEGGLSGLSLKKVEKRLAELDRASGDGWKDVSDPALWGEDGAPGDAIKLEGGPGRTVERELRKFPPGEFDGVSVRMRFDPLPPGVEIHGSILPEPGLCIGIDPVRVLAYTNRLEGGKYALKENGKVAKSGEYVLSLLLARGEYSVLVNGEKVFTHRTDVESITVLRLHSDGTPVSFDRIRLHRK